MALEWVKFLCTKRDCITSFFTFHELNTDLGVPVSRHGDYGPSKVYFY